MGKQHILVVDDDHIIRDSLREFLTLEGYIAQGAKDFTETVHYLKQQDFALVIIDVNLPDGNGLDLLDTIKQLCPRMAVIIVTGFGTIESAVRAIKQGAYDYLTKPVVDDQLLLTIERALQQQSLITENEQLKSELQQRYGLQNIISQDYKMAKLFKLVEAISDSDTTILMTGPSGTGKSMLARAIHYRSRRRMRPFVEVSCGALPETLLESELFGYVRGAFTGAVANKDGKFLAADTGTIFLDEIGNASHAFQSKLLRILEDRQFEPLGSNHTYTVNTRIILATNRNLAEDVKKGHFREDLYYRINVVNIDLPPLRERVGDIPLLTTHFIQKYAKKHNKAKTALAAETLEMMEHYTWPGNVRELENVIERAILLASSPLIQPHDLPHVIINEHKPIKPSTSVPRLKDIRIEPEKHFIRKILDENDWNRKKSAKILGINRTTLYKKMKRYHLSEKTKDK